MKQSTER